MVKSVEAIYVFHVGDEEAASMRQQPAIVRTTTMRVAQDIDMKICSNPADLMREVNACALLWRLD